MEAGTRTPADGSPLTPEEVVIAAVLIGAVPAGGVPLDAEHFGHPEHREVWAAIRAVDEGDRQPDPVTVLAELERRGSKITGKRLSEMTEGLPKVQAVDQWVSLIREAADQRGLRATLIRATEAIESGKYPLQKVRDRLMERILGVGTVQNPSLTYGEALGRAVAAQIDLRCGPKLIGVPTGLTTLDRWTHGVRGVWVVGASTSVGKTAFACQLAMEACRSGVKCLYFSTEMTAADIGLRMVCSEERVSIWDLKVDPMALDGVLRRVGQVPSWGLAIDETSPLTPEHVYSTIRSWRQAHGVGLVIVDHIQHMSGGKSESRNQELTAISRSLQQASRSMNVPLVILSQLSRDRAKQQRRPRLDDLRDSGSIEQDADLVMLIHRNNIADAESQLPHDAELIVAKHRHGATGVVEMTFQPKWTRFEERV